RRNQHRILIPQAVVQLRRKSPGQRRGLVLPPQELCDVLSIFAGLAEQAVRERVGVLACLSVALNGLSEAPQIFDQGNPEGDRDCPQLANGERLNPLIGGYKTDESVEIEPAVRVSNEGPGKPENARISLEVAFGELGQLVIEARGQIVRDLANLLFHDMEIIK